MASLVGFTQEITREEAEKLYGTQYQRMWAVATLDGVLRSAWPNPVDAEFEKKRCETGAAHKGPFAIIEINAEKLLTQQTTEEKD